MTAAERVLQRLPSAKKTAGGWQARCPAHDDRGPSLSIREGRSGALIRCFAGCELAAIVAALGLRVADLFDAPKVRMLPERPQRRLTAREVQEAIRHHLARVMSEERGRLGYTPPIVSRYVNKARMAVNRLFDLQLRPVPAAWWECPPHDSDPLWRVLAERALAVILLERGRTTPAREDFIDAEDAAALQLCEIARHGQSAACEAAA